MMMMMMIIIIIIIIIIICSEFGIPKQELSMAIDTELTSFSNAIKKSISESRNLQVLSL